MRRRKTVGRFDVTVIALGVLGAAGLCLGMLWGLHRLADWLSADPARWLIAAALIAGWIGVWAVIGLAGTLLTALLAR